MHLLRTPTLYIHGYWMQQTVPAGSVSPVMFVCHRYYADIIIGLLQDVALQAALHPYEELEASQFETPPPMYNNNIESTTTCLRGDLLQQRVYQAVVWFSSESVCSFVCPSVRPSVRQSVRPSVRPFVRPSVLPSVRPPACLPVCLSMSGCLSLSCRNMHCCQPSWLATTHVPAAANLECMVDQHPGLKLSCMCIWDFITTWDFQVP